MRSHLRLGLLTLAALALVGCGEESGLTQLPADDSAADQDAIGALMTDAADYFGAGASMSDEQVLVQGDGDQGRSGAASAPIESFYFRREITGRDVRREVVIETPQGERPRARVSTLAHLEGIFHLFYDDPSSIYLPGVIDKRLQAIASHNAVFVRHGRMADRHRGWKLVGTSAGEILSDPTTKDIISVEIVSRSVNTTITDPLEIVPLRELPTFQPGEEVTLKVLTNDETDYVFLHTGFLKDEFEPMGGGLFQGTWHVGERRGARRAAIDVIDADTLFDDEAPYDSAVWVIHYRVAGDPREDFEVE